MSAYLKGFGSTLELMPCSFDISRRLSRNSLSDTMNISNQSIPLSVDFDRALSMLNEEVLTPRVNAAIRESTRISGKK
tara:strand:+ start:165 stop:398 length:234 start_codon:yes stop_codon:yes gene_type:complete